MTTKIKCKECSNRLGCLVHKKDSTNYDQLVEEGIYCPNRYTQYKDNSKKNVTDDTNMFKNMMDWKLDSNIIKRSDCNSIGVIEPKDSDKALKAFLKRSSRYEISGKKVAFYNSRDVNVVVGDYDDRKLHMFDDLCEFVETIDTNVYENVLHYIKGRKYEVGHIHEESPLVFKVDDGTIILAGVLLEQGEHIRKYIREGEACRRETLAKKEEK